MSYILCTFVDDIFVNQLFEKRCLAVGSQDIACTQYQSNYLSTSKPGVGIAALYMLIMGPVCFFVLLLLEWGIFPSFIPAPMSVKRREEDQDVRKERKRVENGHADSDMVVIRDLTRVYRKSGAPNGKFTAVDGLSFGIRSGECFGLLGVYVHVLLL